MNNYFELQKVTKSYDKLQTVTNELRKVTKSYNKLQKVTNELSGAIQKLHFAKSWKNGFPTTMFNGTVNKNTKHARAYLGGR